MKNICIVEDNVDILNLMADLLSYTYNVTRFNNSFDALLWLKKNGGRVDLLFSDINLPDFNGLELGNRIKKIYPNIKILYTSGYMCHIDSKLLEENFLTKPFTLKQLTGRIEEMIKD